jgi:hypothetical protein
VTAVREALRIEMLSSHDAIDLIDAFRARGFEAALADAPGTWDVAATGSVNEIAPVLADEEIPVAVVHVAGRLYVVEAAAEPVPRRAVEAV